MSFKKNVDHYVEQSAKNLNFTSDLLEHIKATHSLIKVNVGVEIDGGIKILLAGEQFIQNIFCLVKVV